MLYLESSSKQKPASYSAVFISYHHLVIKVMYCHLYCIKEKCKNYNWPCLSADTEHACPISCSDQLSKSSFKMSLLFPRSNFSRVKHICVTALPGTITISMGTANTKGYLTNVLLLILLMESNSVSFNLYSHSTSRRLL